MSTLLGEAGDDLEGLSVVNFLCSVPHVLTKGRREFTTDFHALWRDVADRNVPRSLAKLATILRVYRS